MAVLEDCLYVPARLVVVAVLVARSVVKIGDIRIVCHTLVALQHGVFGLYNVQFGEVPLQCIVLFIGLVLRQSICAHQSAGIHVATVLVHAANRHQRGQQAAVALHVDTSHAQILYIGASCIQCLPVYAGTIIHHKACDIARAL